MHPLLRFSNAKLMTWAAVFCTAALVVSVGVSKVSAGPALSANEDDIRAGPATAHVDKRYATHGAAVDTLLAQHRHGHTGGAVTSLAATGLDPAQYGE